jgi:hypothetical protein
VGEVGEMLIITYDAFHADLVPLVEWKNRMGLRTRLVDLTEVGADSAAVRRFIRSAYDSTDLAFVLLVGDAAQMPYPLASGAAADPTYALVAGADTYPDLFIGRFSASTPYQVRTQVERTIRYERDPDTEDAWYGAAAGVASAEGPGDDEELDFEHIDVIRDRLLGFTYSDVDRIYDPGATAADLTNALNDGRGLVNYCGHGSITSWGTTGFSNAHIAALANHDRLPFIFNVACLNGEFTSGTCMAEQWLRATHGGFPTGAVGIYASSLNQTWDPPMAAQDECIDLLVRGKRRTFGGLCFNGSCQMMDEYGFNGAQMFASWHVFGDPSLRVRTDTPARLSVDHAAVIARDAASFAVEVGGSEPVEGALCGLSRAGAFVGSAFTGPDGTAAIPIDGSLEIGELLDLTVTAFNHEAFMGEARVVAAPRCNVDPVVVEIALPPGGSGRSELSIENDGDPGSVLSFVLYVMPHAQKELTGSSIVADRTGYDPGTTFDLRFAITNTSSDYECIKGASIGFPSAVEVGGSTDFLVVGSTRKLLTDAASGNGAEVTWSAPGYWGEIYPGEIAEAAVTITVPPDFLEEIEIDWQLNGDGWGEPPHVLYGGISIPLSGPALHLHAPSGGEVYLPGDVVPITWASSGKVNDLSLFLSTDNGSTWSIIAERLDDDGHYEWTVPSSPSEDCFVRIVGDGGAASDASDDPFRIAEPVTWLSVSPAAGTVGAGELATAELLFDGDGLSLGDHEATLIVANNAGPPVSVPVTLRIATIDIDPKLSTVESNSGIVVSPGGDADSTLRVTVTARDGSGRGIQGIGAGSVTVTASGSSWLGEGMTFCSSGLPHASFPSTTPTDENGRTTIEVNRIGGCGAIELRASIAGIDVRDPFQALVRSPDLNGDGSVSFPDVFLFTPMLHAGDGPCGNFDGDPADIVNFSDTALFIRFFSAQGSCP